MAKSAIKCYVNTTGTYNQKNARKTQKWSYFENSYVNVTWTLENYNYSLLCCFNINNNNYSSIWYFYISVFTYLLLPPLAYIVYNINYQLNQCVQYINIAQPFSPLHCTTAYSVKSDLCTALSNLFCNWRNSINFHLLGLGIELLLCVPACFWFACVRVSILLGFILLLKVFL